MKQFKIASAVISLVFILGLLVIVGCSDGVDAGNKEPIKIGATLVLSGKFAFIGEQELNGMSMAVDEINSKGGVNGRRLQLIVEDNKGDTKEGVTNVNKFISSDDVDVVFSAFTHITSGVKDIVTSNGKKSYYASTVPDFAKESKYAFRDYFDAGDQGKILAQKVANDKRERIAYLTEVSDVAKVFENGFKEVAQEEAITITAREKFQADATDVKTQLLKLDLNEVDALIVVGWKHETIIMKQLKELGFIDVPTYHLVGPFLPSADTTEMRALYEENNAVSAWYGIADVVTGDAGEFVKKYNVRFNKSPRADATYAYDDIYALAEAFDGCENEDSDCVAEHLLNTNLEGAGGRLTFDSDGVSQREVLLIHVRDGKWVEVE